MVSQVYTFTTTKFQPLVGAGENGQPSEGQRLIQKCLVRFVPFCLISLNLSLIRFFSEQAVDPSEADSDYISPPPDGPLLPLPPSAQKRPFEANSPIHGGQIALRTKQQRPRAKRPAPISMPSTGSSGSHPPTPSIHATMEGLPIPPSPHQVHPLNQAPLPSPGLQMRDYPPSPGYPPGPNGQRDPPSVLQSSNNYNEMMDRSQMNQNGNNGQYGPPTNYPPPPALGYTHTVVSLSTFLSFLRDSFLTFPFLAHSSRIRIDHLILSIRTRITNSNNRIPCINRTIPLLLLLSNKLADTFKHLNSMAVMLLLLPLLVLSQVNNQTLQIRTATIECNTSKINK